MITLKRAKRKGKFRYLVVCHFPPFTKQEDIQYNFIALHSREYYVVTFTIMMVFLLRSYCRLIMRKQVEITFPTVDTALFMLLFTVNKNMTRFIRS